MIRKKLQDHVNKLMGKKIKTEKLLQCSKDKLLANEFKHCLIAEIDLINETFDKTNGTFDLFYKLPKKKIRMKYLKLSMT